MTAATREFDLAMFLARRLEGNPEGSPVYRAALALWRRHFGAALWQLQRTYLSREDEPEYCQTRAARRWLRSESRHIERIVDYVYRRPKYVPTKGMPW